MSTDPVAARIGYLRACTDAATATPEAFDLPVLLGDWGKALDALAHVLAAHHDSGGRCAWCRDADGQRSKWPCGEYLTIRARLGEDITDEH